MAVFETCGAILEKKKAFYNILRVIFFKNAGNTQLLTHSSRLLIEKLRKGQRRMTEIVFQK